MIEFVYGHDKEVTQFMAQLIPSGDDISRCKTIGVVDQDGSLIAGMSYFNYDPDAGTMEWGVASTTPRWLSRTTYRRMFEYPFIECGCQMLRTYARIDNERILSLLARMNFNFTIVPRWFGRAEDGVLCTLTDDQWLDGRIAKWIYRDVRNKEAA
jgi:RimJ/RimL family protein N-acetyltransferase